MRALAYENDMQWSSGCLTRLPERARGRGSAGFTLIELLLVVSILVILGAVAVPSLRNTVRDARANAGMRAAMGQFKSARDLAMTARRLVEVQFLGTNQIQLSRIDGAVSTVVSNVTLENGMEFRTFTGLPDTPDQYGLTGAVSFGAAARIFFMTDGSLVDINGVPATGTVFLGVSNVSITARALTVLGATGRIQGYRWDGRQWQQ